MIRGAFFSAKIMPCIGTIPSNMPMGRSQPAGDSCWLMQDQTIASRLAPTHEGFQGFQWVDIAVAGVLLLAAVAVVPARPVEALLPSSGVVTGGEAVEGLAAVPAGAVLCAEYGVGNSPAGGISPLLGWLQPARDATASMAQNR